MDFSSARHNMVEGQVRTNKVTNSMLIEAISDIAREKFLPEGLRARAYTDEDIEVAPGRIMMEPMVAARMMQEAGVCQDDLCMVVASATGYEAACLARMAGAVVAVESNEDLAAASGAAIENAGVNTVSVVNGKIDKGNPSQAPYDVIFINGSVSRIPEQLTDQLAEGGRLVAVVAGPGNAQGHATIAVKNGGVVSERTLFDANIPRLPELTRQPAFTF